MVPSECSDVSIRHPPRLDSQRTRRSVLMFNHLPRLCARDPRSYRTRRATRDASIGRICIQRRKESWSPRSTWRIWPGLGSTRRSSGFASSVTSASAAAPWKRVRARRYCYSRRMARAQSRPRTGNGELHLAFAIRAEELAAWEDWLTENGIAVDEKRAWDLGGQSIYFSAPDRYLIEIATPGVWAIY
jgi:catechol 2,3-dioxygenase-like lactoylglutathione lyase family enzyme